MHAKLQVISISILILMVVSPVLHSQYQNGGICYEYNGEAIEDQKNYYSKMFPMPNGQEREVCYETKVKCEGSYIVGIAEWNVYKIPYPLNLTIPWFDWFAISGDMVDYCGNVNDFALLAFYNVKEWSTSCGFFDGSEFSVKITEVDPAKCGIEN